MNKIIDRIKQHRIIVGTIVFLFLLIAVPVTVNFLGQQQETRSRAAGGTIAVKLNPLTKTLIVGEAFLVDVSLEGTATNLSAVDITFTYNPELLAPVHGECAPPPPEQQNDPYYCLGDFSPSGSFKTILIETNIPGSLRYVGVNPSTESINPPVRIGNLALRALKTSTATVGFSDIHINASGVDGALPIDTTNTKPGTYTITDATVSVTPSPTDSGCLGGPAGCPTPTPPANLDKRLFDFNDDGVMDEIDLNLMLSSFKTRAGD